MKVAAIGDIHGTTKFQDCYDQINNSDNELDVDIWMIDNQRKSEYFIIKIEKSE